MASQQLPFLPVSCHPRYLHMACEDDNNAFSVNFRTTPRDSTVLR